ncbi:hypothetical protein [Bradyrhizobium brasilense]|uniref:hypothetical protein n=1 Tax=Bradyrhizobium brasilense TaxID=1419277 RepID=UPI001E440097|nr:hypothetical protein [Bradyrhizobium brasilense]
MIRTRLATLPDADAISALLTANSGEHGGMLLGQWPREAIEARIASGQSIVVATDDEGRLLGALLTSEKGYGEAPPVQAMLKAWPGRADAYVYGPVCVSRDARALAFWRRYTRSFRRRSPAARQSSSSGKTTRAR